MRSGLRWQHTLLGVLLLTAACTELVEPVVPGEELGPEGEIPVGADTTATPIYLKAVTCTVTLEPAKATCTPIDSVPPADTTAGDGQAKVILGGQGRYISLEMSGESYNVGSQVFSVNVSVRNLIGQSLGTTDGSTPSGLGTRVFLATGPLATSGTGTVALTGADGSGNFTASNQKYLQYNGVIQPLQASSPRSWTFSMPPTVTSYTFTAYVSTPVQYPDGWVSIGGAPTPMMPTTSWKLTATRRDVVGDPMPSGGMTWATADSTIAQIASNGMVTAHRAGAVIITAEKTGATGAKTINVSGMTRVWTGASSTDYHTRANWQHGVIPVTADSILVPFSGITNFPFLGGAAQISGVTVEAGANLNVGVFDLTTTGDVTTGITGGILGSTGRVVLSGIAKNVAGILPRVSLTGTYTQTANLTTTAPFLVTSGRLTDSSFRLQVNP